MFIRRTSWTRQPQIPTGIDWSNPITRGLVLATTGDLQRNFVTNKPQVKVGAGSPSSVVTTKGVGVESASAAAFQASGQIIGNGDVTCLMFGSPTSASASKTALFQQGSAGDMMFGANVDEQFNYSAGRLGLSLLQSGANRSSAYVSGAIDGSLSAYLIGKKAGQPLAYKNGVKLTASLTGDLAGAPSTTSDSYAVFGYITNGAAKFEQPLLLVACWNRLLSDIEAKSVTENPWQIFAAQARPIFVAAGGGTTIATIPGDCAAAGIAALIPQSTIIPTVSATAQASGVTASLTSAVTIPTTPGNTQASGIAASIIRATNIATASGLANASGVQAIISTSNSILTSPGNASASGVTASLATQITITTVPGNANAGGVQAAILSNLFTLPGDAQASGVSALITYATPHTITARPGNAYATGSRISIPGIFYIGLSSPITQEADLIDPMLLASLESAPLYKAVALASTIGL